MVIVIFPRINKKAFQLEAYRPHIRILVPHSCRERFWDRVGLLPPWSFPLEGDGLLPCCPSAFWDRDSTVDRITDTTENITFARTTYVVGKMKNCHSYKDIGLEFCIQRIQVYNENNAQIYYAGETFSVTPLFVRLEGGIRNQKYCFHSPLGVYEV